jgi:transposase
MVAAAIAAVVRMHEHTVRRWLVRYQAEGLNGLADAPRPGAAQRATAAYREQLLALVRRRPRALGLPFSLWTGDRLSNYLAERTGVRMSRASVYRLLRAGGVHLNRPQHTITSPDPEYATKKNGYRARQAAHPALRPRRGELAHGRDRGARAPAEATP